MNISITLYSAIFDICEVDACNIITLNNYTLKQHIMVNQTYYENGTSFKNYLG